MRTVKCVFIIILILTVSLQAQELERHLQKGLATIDPADTYNYCKEMTKPEFAGRYTGHQGYTDAANWAGNLFKKWKLKPMNKEEGYLQAFPAPYCDVVSAEMKFLLNDGKTVTLVHEDDYLPLLSTDSGTHTAGVVFAGWGVHAPDLGYDDYHDIDVRGKYVLCFRGVPDRRNPAFSPHNEHRRRMSVAKEKGALGIFYIYNLPITNPNMDWIEGFTPTVISEKTADILFEEKGINSTDLKADLQTYKRPISFELPAEISYSVESEYHPDGIGYNVVGYIEGSDSQLKKECIVIGGHYDHTGYHLGILFPGANDNASGSAVVMEAAEAFAKTGKRPKRSVVFVLFGGEEMGLKGSKYFVDNVPSQFTRVDAMYNFDMTGEGDMARGSASADPGAFSQGIKDADKFVNTLTRLGVMRRGSGGGSDYAPFNAVGITCASFSSNGPHLHYHRSGDNIYRVNPDIMADITKLVYIAAYRWADR
ncbi:MAG: M20/M25/M40 family metallo-hydrolase [bacterium]|nr:M20/M25/M40 family metallo-hydrolase [bacterium]